MPEVHQHWGVFISGILLEYIGEIDDLRKHHREICTKYVRSARDSVEFVSTPDQPTHWPKVRMR